MWLNHDPLSRSFTIFSGFETKMREFRSLSLRTFDEISLENSSVVSRCFQRNFSKTKRENLPHFRAQRENSLKQREKIRRIFETSAKIRCIFKTSAKNQKRNFACCTRNFVVWFVKINHISIGYSVL